MNMLWQLRRQHNILILLYYALIHAQHHASSFDNIEAAPRPGFLIPVYPPNENTFDYCRRGAPPLPKTRRPSQPCHSLAYPRQQPRSAWRQHAEP